jgi:hypothetical protein
VLLEIGDAWLAHRDAMAWLRKGNDFLRAYAACASRETKNEEGRMKNEKRRRF